MGFSGYEYIWWNRRDGNELMEERLDRCGVFVKWLFIFFNVNVFYLDEKLFDYLFILLKLNKKDMYRRKGRKGFKFENMWVIKSFYKEVVKNTWERNDRGNVSYIFEAKIGLREMVLRK